MIDPYKTIEESIEHLTILVSQLGSSYDLLYDTEIDLTGLGETVDALMFANTKLSEQDKIIKDAQRKKLAKLNEEGK